MTATHNEMKACNMCGNESADLPESGRCGECQSLKTRLCRHFAKDGGKERKQWDSLTKEQRKVFYSQWHGQVGIDLKAAITETMVETTKESKHETSTLLLIWMDDYQLSQKYKDRPEEIEKIKKNGQSIECKYRGVTLWGHPEYVSKEVASSTSSRERKRDLSAKEISRPHKKPRVGRPPATEPGKLSEKEVVNLGYEKNKLQELLNIVKLTHHKASLPELSDCTKKRDRDQLELKEYKLRTVIVAIDAATELKSGDFKKWKREIAAVRSATNPPLSKLKQSVAIAAKELDREGAEIVKQSMDKYEAELKAEVKDDSVAVPEEEKEDESETEVVTKKPEESIDAD